MLFVGQIKKPHDTAPSEGKEFTHSKMSSDRKSKTYITRIEPVVDTYKEHSE